MVPFNSRISPVTLLWIEDISTLTPPFIWSFFILVMLGIFREFLLVDQLSEIYQLWFWSLAVPTLSDVGYFLWLFPLTSVKVEFHFETSWRHQVHCQLGFTVISVFLDCLGQGSNPAVGFLRQWQRVIAYVHYFTLSVWRHIFISELVNNQEHFYINSDLHDIITKNKGHLHRPIANLLFKKKIG